MSLLKILILGSQNTGKTSFIKKLTTNNFCDSYLPTNELELSKKVFENDGISYDINISEIPYSFKSNTEEFDKLLEDYIGIIIFFDINNNETVENTLKIKEEIEKIESPNLEDGKILTFLIESKCDLLEDNQYEKEKEKIDKFIEKYKFNGGFLVSSKNGKNINESFEFIILEIIKKMKKEEDEYSISLESQDKIEIDKIEISVNDKDDNIITLSFVEYDRYSDEFEYEYEIDLKKLKKEYSIFELVKDANEFIDIFNLLKERNKVKINLYLKEIVIQVSALFYSIYGDEEELTFELIYKELNPEDLPKRLFNILCEEIELN